jgi:hypothetical protein
MPSTAGVGFGVDHTNRSGAPRGLAAQPRGKEEAEAEKTAVLPGVNDIG